MPDCAATKSANILTTVSLVKEVGNSGVTVNTVSPGTVVTPGVEFLHRQLALNECAIRLTVLDFFGHKS